MDLKMLWDMVSMAAGPLSDLYKSVDNHFKAKQDAVLDHLKRDLYWLFLGFSNRSMLPDVPVEVQKTYASLAASSQIIMDHILNFRNHPQIEYEFMPPEVINNEGNSFHKLLPRETLKKLLEYNFWNLSQAQQLAYLIYYRDEVIKVTNYDLERYIGRLAYQTIIAGWTDSRTNP